LDGEEEDQHDPQPEVRRADPAKRKQRRTVVDRRITTGGAQHAQRNRKDDSNDSRSDGQFDRRRHPLEDHLRDFEPFDVRIPHIALHQVGEVLDVLDVYRLIEAEFGRDRLPGLLGGI
jgi:hypothetical protein